MKNDQSEKINRVFKNRANFRSAICEIGKSGAGLRRVNFEGNFFENLRFHSRKNKIETAQKAGLKKFEKLTREKMLAAAAEIFEKIDAGFLKNLEENFD